MDVWAWVSELHPECKLLVVSLVVAVGALWRNAARAAAMQEEIIRQQGQRLDRLIERYEIT